MKKVTILSSDGSGRYDVDAEVFSDVLYSLLEENRIRGAKAKLLSFYRFRKSWRDYLVVGEFLRSKWSASLKNL